MSQAGDDISASDRGDLETIRTIAGDTLAGDLMDNILDVVRALPKPWQQMTEDEHTETIKNIRTRCEYMVGQTVHILARRNHAAVRVKVDSVNFKDGVKMTASMGKVDGAHYLADATGETVVVVLCDAEEYFGERSEERAEPDQHALPMGADEAEGEYDSETGEITEPEPEAETEAEPEAQAEAGGDAAEASDEVDPMVIPDALDRKKNPRAGDPGYVDKTEHLTPAEANAELAQAGT